MDLKVCEFFPLSSPESVINLIKNQLENDEKEVNLTLISICLGFFENILCNENRENKSTFPSLDYETFDELYKKFKSIVSIAETGVQASQTTKGKSKSAAVAAAAAAAAESREPKVATREKIKKISDVIWNSLLRSSYKDRIHLQSVYSYLVGNKLDSFGVALVTVAACQLLNYKDVHLALGEDHVWIVFGEDEETMEITWHGKIAEDKRGQSVAPGIEAHTWLYLAGNPVICTRFTEIAVMVLSINPHLSPTSVCAELADLQQQLLWILYDHGHLRNYPMGLMYLGEMEENHATADRPKCEQLYEEAIQSSITNYKNHHVYPYSCKGNYYYRNENFRDAFRCWADAGDVIRLYNYSRDDEEIYKEFLDIANEQIPQIMKTESSGHSAKSILRDPHCFANLLRFYDGICQWEEGSLTPILHIGWAKQLCFSISKFDYDIRSQVKIIIKSDFDDDNNNKKVTESPLASSSAVASPEEDPKKSESVKPATEPMKSPSNLNGSGGDVKNEFPMLPSLDELTAACGEKILNPDFLLHGGGVPFTEPGEDDDEKMAVANGCGGGGGADKKVEASAKVETINNAVKSPKSIEEKSVLSPIQKDLASPQSIASPQLASPSSVTTASVEDSKSDALKLATSEEDQSNDTNNNTNGKATAGAATSEGEDDFDLHSPKRPIITLKSRKMKGLKDLLLAEKLNTNAISLQITAQSTQSHTGNKKSRSSMATGAAAGEEAIADGSRPKRTRRE